MNDDDGRVIPDAVGDELAKLIAAPNVYASMFEHRPPTRRERLAALLNEARWRIVTAIKVLAGRHVCSDL